MKNITGVINFFIIIALLSVFDAVAQDSERDAECINRLLSNRQGIGSTYDPECTDDSSDRSEGPKEAKYVYIETEKPQPNYSLHAKRFIFSPTTNIHTDKLEIISVQSFDEIPSNDLEKYRNEGKRSDVIVLNGNASVKVHSIRHREGYYGGIGIDRDMMKYLYLQKYPDESERFQGSKKVYIVGQVTEYSGPDQYDRTESFHEIVELRGQESKRSIDPIIMPFDLNKPFGGAAGYSKPSYRYSPPKYKPPTYRFVPRR